VIALSQDRADMAEMGPDRDAAMLGHFDPYLAPDLAVMRALGARGLPTTVVDRQTRKLARLEDPAESDEAAVTAYFRALRGQC